MQIRVIKAPDNIKNMDEFTKWYNHFVNNYFLFVIHTKKNREAFGFSKFKDNRIEYIINGETSTRNCLFESLNMVFTFLIKID